MIAETPIRNRSKLILLILVLLRTAVSSGFGEDGVTKDRIVFGQSCVLEGPASALGHGMRDGILAAFQEANATGGVNGRLLELKSLDDGYEPDLALKNTRQLIEKEKAFALVGYVGTPTARECLPLILETGIPLIGPFTGAEFLRRSSYTNIINLRASYAQETESWIDYLTRELGLSRIAILFQDDSFGHSGLSGVREALERRGLRLVARGTYARNLTAIHSALFTIRRAQPEAVVMVGTYRPCAEFIKLAHSLDFNPKFVNISFVGARALAEHLKENGNGVIVSQVVPSPWDKTLPLVQSYQRALTNLGGRHEFDFVSLEGYLAGSLIVAALNTLKDTITRASFLNAFHRPDGLEVHGMKFTLAPGGNQLSDTVFLTQIDKDGRFNLVKTYSVSRAGAGRFESRKAE